MKEETLDVIIKVAACVCGKDGVISQAEEEAIFETIKINYPNYSLDRFNQIVDEFFDESLQLEHYLNQVSSLGKHSFIVNLCEFSASADGLDIKENIALNKVKLILRENS